MKISRASFWGTLIPAIMGMAFSPQRAEAVIILGGQPLAGGINQPGELFLSVWDQAAAKSYSLDLGVSVADMWNNPNMSRTWNLGPLWADFASTGDPLKFNVAGSSSYLGPGVTGGAGNVLDGVMLSHAPGFQLNTANIAVTNLPPLNALVESRADAINQAACGGTLTACNVDWAANLSQVSNASSAAYYDNLWGDGAVTGWTTAVSVRNVFSPVTGDVPPDGVLQLFFIHPPATIPSRGGIVTVDAVGGGGALDPLDKKPGDTNMVFRLDANAGTLTWGANSSATPTPATPTPATPTPATPTPATPTPATPTPATPTPATPTPATPTPATPTPATPTPTFTPTPIPGPGPGSSADLSLKIKSVKRAKVNKTFSYSFEVSNKSRSTAPSSSVAIQIDAGETAFQILRVQPSTCTVSGDEFLGYELNCDTGALRGKRTAKILLKGTAMAPGTVSVGAAVSSDSGSDPRPSNNSDSKSTLVR